MKILAPTALEVRRYAEDISELRGKVLKPHGVACVGKSFIELSDRVKKHLHGKSIFDFFTVIDLAHILIIVKKTTTRLLFGLLPNDGNTKTGTNFMEGMSDWTPNEKKELALLLDKNRIMTDELILMGNIRKNVQKTSIFTMLCG